METHFFRYIHRPSHTTAQKRDSIRGKCREVCLTYPFMPLPPLVVGRVRVVRLRCPVCFLAMTRLRRTPTAAHAFALLYLPLAAQSNAAYETFPGGSLHTFSPVRKYARPHNVEGLLQSPSQPVRLTAPFRQGGLFRFRPVWQGAFPRPLRWLPRRWRTE